MRGDGWGWWWGGGRGGGGCRGAAAIACVAAADAAGGRVLRLRRCSWDGNAALPAGDSATAAATATYGGAVALTNGEFEVDAARRGA